MNRLTANVIGTVIAVIVIFFLGRLFLLSNLQTEINQTHLQLQENEKKFEQLSSELAKITPAEGNETLTAAAGKKAPQADSKMLRAGEESSLLRQIADNAGKSFRINSFDLIESFMLKPSAADEAANVSQSFSTVGEELPQLDDQGMPVGVATDDDEEWPGVEIIPIRITFSTTFRTLGKFLSDAGRNMPVNSVRSLDVIMRDDGLVKGTLVMNFPLAEGR